MMPGMADDKTVQLALRVKASTAKDIAAFIEKLQERLNSGQPSANRALMYQIGMMLTAGKLSEAFVREARIKQVGFEEFYRDMVQAHLAEVNRNLEERRPFIHHADNAPISYLANLGYADPLVVAYRGLCAQLGVVPTVVEEPPPLGRAKGSVRGSFAEIYPFRNACHGSTSLQDFSARLRKAGIHWEDRTPRERKGKPTGEDWIFTFISVDGVKPGHQLNGSQLGLYKNTMRGFDRRPVTLLQLWSDGGKLLFRDPEELVHSAVRAVQARDSRSKSRKS